MAKNNTKKTSKIIPQAPGIVKPKRAPSPYNLHMKQAMAQIKAQNPDMPHKEAFKQAASTWKDQRNKSE